MSIYYSIFFNCYFGEAIQELIEKLYVCPIHNSGKGYFVFNRNYYMDTSKKSSVGLRPKKFFGKFKKPLVSFPNFVEPQLSSFQWLIEEGIAEVFQEFKAIDDYSGKKFTLEFTGFELSKPKYDEFYAKQNKLSYEAPINVKVKLYNKITGSEKEQELFMADFPMMTNHGTFIISGIERVIVPQLARSYGVFFTATESKGRKLFGAKVIPSRGAWIEIETDNDNALQVRIDRKRKFAAASLLRVMSGESDKEILSNFTDEEKEFLKKTFEKDHATTIDESYIEIHRRLRDGDLATIDNAKEFINSIFSEERYDLSNVGRHMFNKRFGKDLSKKAIEQKTLSFDDIITIVKNIIALNITPGAMADDIDDLGSRRVRFVGELLQQKVRMGMSQIKRNVQNRMSTVDSDISLPMQFISPKPLQARVKEFFTTNQLSQFMSQENALTEIEHLRTLSALGPGGLNRARAGFEVRDVHTSHYGRVCPIHTPEGPNIGLIVRLALYAKVNDFGMIETPYAKVEKGKITGEIVYMNASEERSFVIAHAATNYDDNGVIKDVGVEVRISGVPHTVAKNTVQYIDVATNQAFSVATSMIPFLNHDDANRALMGSNMQKQATPSIVPEAPLVATGIEEKAVLDTGRLVIAEEDGEVTASDGRHIEVKNKSNKKHNYKLINFSRTNGFTAFHQRPIVDIGDKVKKGEVIGDTSK